MIAVAVEMHRPLHEVEQLTREELYEIAAYFKIRSKAIEERSKAKR